MAVVPFLQGGTTLGVVAYRSLRIIETAGEPLFGGIAHAPLAVMLMVAEMTGNLSLLAPAMIAVGISYLIVGDTTIYTSQLPSRAESPAHRYRYAFPLLSSLTVGDAMNRQPLTFSPDRRVEEAARTLRGANASGAPVVDATGVLLGVLTQADIARVPEDAYAVTHVSDIVMQEAITVPPSTHLDDALEELTEHRISWMPVVDAEQHVLGVITAADITRAYRTASVGGARRLNAFAKETSVLEFTLHPEAPIAGKTLAGAQLPSGTLVVAIVRDGVTVVPQGTTVLTPGDVVIVVSDPRAEEQVRATFTAPLAAVVTTDS